MVKILSEWECKRKAEARDANAIGLEIEKRPPVETGGLPIT
jgi:hypothetical protein